jgi:hypothetical protein
MIENATITSIARVTGATGSGAVTRTAEAVSIRCLACDPTSAQRWALGAVIADASMTVYVGLEELSGVPLNDKDKLTVTVDGLAAKVLEVIKVVTVVKDGGLSHCEAFCK